MSDIKEATVPTLVFGEVFEEKQVPVERKPKRKQGRSWMSRC